jgi:hypothetical protein
MNPNRENLEKSIGDLRLSARHDRWHAVSSFGLSAVSFAVGAWGVEIISSGDKAGWLVLALGGAGAGGLELDGFAELDDLRDVRETMTSEQSQLERLDATN